MSDITYIAGSKDLDKLARARTLMPFAQECLDFLNDFSKKILSSSQFREFPEMIALAYWMRRSQLKTLQTQFSNKTKSGLLLARGTVFHIAPSNVDAIFLYSMILSMLVGNKNVVRISSKDSEQVNLVLVLLDELLQQPEYVSFKDSTAVLTYSRSDKVTSDLSKICDVRVIWGGDVSINSIRQIPIRPHVTELCFPDKTSLAVFDARHFNFLHEKSQKELVTNFINDTYVFGQMACSSPHLLVWRGTEDDISMASKLFWNLIEEQIFATDHDINDVDFMNKLVGEQLIASSNVASIRASKTNKLSVVKLSNIQEFDNKYRIGSGFFLESSVQNLTELKAICFVNTQTVISSGIKSDDWRSFVSTSGQHIADRIVPPGQALNFFHVWDGMDLLREFVRETTIMAGD